MDTRSDTTAPHSGQANPILRYPLGCLTPDELVACQDLDDRDKLSILRQWEHDTVELLVADEENMSGGAPPPVGLAEIRAAIRGLRQDRAADGAGGRDGEAVSVADVMTRAVRTVHSDNRIRDVARQMAADGVGLFVVLDGDEVVGVVTDRDLVVRALAGGIDPDRQAVATVMTNRIVAVSRGASLSEAGDIMMAAGVRRLCVLDDAGGLVGVLSLTDLALDGQGEAAMGRVLRGIVRASPEAVPEHAPATSRHSEATRPGGLPVYSLRPQVRA